MNLQGDPATAQVALGEALDLARPGGFVRVFTDLGPPMQALLEGLAEQGVAVQQLLAAFPTDSRHYAAVPARGVAAQVVPGHVAFAAMSGLVEPLTVREQQVLALLGQPLSNKEIARPAQHLHAHREAPHDQHLWQAWRPFALGCRRQGCDAPAGRTTLAFHLHCVSLRLHPFAPPGCYHSAPAHATVNS